MALLTADWNPLGKEAYYRKFELYSMGWSDQVNLQDLIVAVAPYGGCIAVVRNERKFTRVQVSGKPSVFIFSAAGELISSIKWTSNVIVALGWTLTEDLLCILDDGTVLFYNMFGTYQEKISMGQEAKDTKIIDAQTFESQGGTGLVVLTTNYRFFLVNNVKNPRIRKLAEVPGLNIPPSSWTLVCEETFTRVLVAKDKEVYNVDHREQHAVQHIPEFSHHFLSIVAMAISPCLKHVALFADSGYLWLGSSDFKRKYCEFDTQCTNTPSQLVWCGSGAVLCNLGSLILVVSPTKDNFQLLVDSAPFLFAEADGVRIITNQGHEFLHKVHTSSQEVFRIGSMAPGAILLEAAREFQRRSHRAEEYLRMVKDQLRTAVDQCIQAAGQEWQPGIQKMLLRAAQLGKTFLPELDPEPFVTMCQTLRILNAVRNYKVALPLTYTQLEHLTRLVLIDRLVLRRQYAVAIQIAKYLRLPDSEGASRIMAHWACYKVKNQKHVDSEQLALEISSKLGHCPGISYSSIAREAIKNNRKELAARLLDFEPRASEQIPLLLQLEQERQALVKAVDSGDSDLIYSVLVALKEKHKLAEFHMIIRQYPTVLALYAKLCEQSQIGSLRDVYVQEDDFVGQAVLNIKEAYEKPRIEDRSASLTSAVDLFRRVKSDWAATVTEEQVRLLNLQRDYTKSLQVNFVNLSLHETMKLLIQRGEAKKLDDLSKKFKLSEKRIWWLKVTTWAEIGDWSELEKLSRLKKSPIGYEPFVDACLDHGNLAEAKRYLPQVQEDLQVKYYVKAKLYAEAAQIAFSHKDTEALHFIQSRCASDRQMVDKINDYVTQLATPNFMGRR
nr:EOG090X01BU [Eulimnadia texana]